MSRPQPAGQARIMGVQTLIGAIHNGHQGGSWDLVGMVTRGRLTSLVFKVGVLDVDYATGIVTDNRAVVRITVEEED